MDAKIATETDWNIESDDDRYEIAYVKQKTGATTQEIKIAMASVGKNWVNVICYLRREK